MRSPRPAPASSAAAPCMAAVMVVTIMANATRVSATALRVAIRAIPTTTMVRTTKMAAPRAIRDARAATSRLSSQTVGNAKETPKGPARVLFLRIELSILANCVNSHSFGSVSTADYGMLSADLTAPDRVVEQLPTLQGLHDADKQQSCARTQGRSALRHPGRAAPRRYRLVRRTVDAAGRGGRIFPASRCAGARLVAYLECRGGRIVVGRIARGKLDGGVAPGRASCPVPPSRLPGSKRLVNLSRGPQARRTERNKNECRAHDQKSSGDSV